MIFTINKKVQLFLLHFAGGSSYSFDFFKKYNSELVDFLPLELPGRGKRFDQDFLDNKQSCVQDYVRQIKSLRNKDLPYIIYGHSMGATLGLSVTFEMEKTGDYPIQLIVTGNSGPGISYDLEDEDSKIRYCLNDEEFKQEVISLGGMPKEVINNDDLFEFFIPILRADFKVVETNLDYEKNTVIKTPIHALMGSEEKHQDKIDNWSEYTIGHFDYDILNGDHFFIYDHPQKVTETFKNCLTNTGVLY
ncbi:thioesterase II family protein [Aquimarina litoralis]|uniref:thioesterase II family protein n=1 Tax=Aquimarina litoralis TaxID=584605 RepID=UPI001C5906E2|nr:thioesterase domain-containing protein [Aquimarina litoralis]MBW1295673.1 thioesterase [Aquimarina litoralis]